METPDRPFMTPRFRASKQVATWHPMTSQGFLAGKCLTPTQLLICSSFSRENGHLLLICSSLSTSQLGQEKCGFFCGANPSDSTTSRRTLTIWRKANNIMVLAQVGRVFGRVRSEKLRYFWMKTICQWIQFVTFLSPNVRGHVYNLLKGSLNYPKKATFAELPGGCCFQKD